MVEQTVQVTEGMAEFIEWVASKGEDDVREMIRDWLAELKKHSEDVGNTHKKGEIGWDAALEPNDGNDQWKHGGDCNLCRKASYCLTKCRANKMLKKFTTPLLYQAYLDDVPEAAAKHSGAFDNEAMMKQLGVIQ